MEKKNGTYASAGQSSDWLGRLTAWAQQAWPRTRLVAPAVVGALLLTPFVLDQQLSRWMSPSPFFSYIHFILFFFPSPSPAGAYLERSVITILFVAAGTGIAFLAVCGCIWIDDDGVEAYASAKSRAIGVCVLMLLCSTSGCLSSYAPRLKSACRAVVFSTLWELTSQYTVISARIFFDNFYPPLVAMIVGVFCNFIIFPRTARHTSIVQFCDLLDATQRLTTMAVDDFFLERTVSRDAAGNAASSTQTPTFRRFKDQVQVLQNRLEFNLDAAVYELSFARVPIGQLQPFLAILRDIRGWFSCGLVCLQDASSADEPTNGSDRPTDTPAFNTSEPSAFDFQGAIRGFSTDIIMSLSCLCHCMSKMAGAEKLGKTHSSPRTLKEDPGHVMDLADPHFTLSQQRAHLRASIRSFKSALSDAIKSSRTEVVQTARSDHVSDQDGALTSDMGTQLDTPQLSTPAQEPAGLDHLFRNDSYRISLLMISLLEVALLVDSCLKVALSVARTWERNPHRKLRMPAAKWRYWLGRTSIGQGEGFAFDDERVDALLHEDEPPSPTSEAQLDEVDYFDNGSNELLTASSKLERTPSRVSNSIDSVRMWIGARYRAVRSLFNTRRVLRYRFRLSDTVEMLRHSRHIKFGIKLTAGVVLLTLPAWLAPGEGKQWWLDKRGQWMAISYLFCLETSTGASVRTSLFRILGTISGSILGLVVSEVSRGNPYALAFLLTVATIPPSYLMLFTQLQGVGIVMGLTLPIVALIPQEGGSESVVYVAWNRGYMIFFGIVAALLVNLFIWPIHAHVELVHKISSITSQLQSLYLSLSRQMLSGGLTWSHKSNAAFAKLEIGIEKRISQARGLVDIMSMEVSLKPKRTRVLSELLDHLEIIHELLIGLRRCREHGLRSVRQHAVVNVLELRQSLIASVLLVLWTTGQALQTRAPLPQCLPSPRLALEELTEAVAEQLQLMVKGAEQSPHFARDRTGMPDAFHALDSLNQSNILVNVRRRHRKHVGLHSIQSYSPMNGSRSASPSRDPPQRLSADTPATAIKKSLDYAMFFILAEHALLEEIVTSLERLLELCRIMVGEASFLRTEMVPDIARGLDDIRTSGAITPAVPTRAVEVSDGGSEADAMPRHLLSAQPPESTPIPYRSTARSPLAPDVPSRTRDVSPMNHPLHSSNLRSSPVINQPQNT
ncbi:hypothetical protein EX895_001959 [Sporisorium graminicola]|uniref:Integral membrane bound transporter domain-containing protein n=1 Tax=Sporisorium graminicola TaxID=280036 RepID=A0A4U7L108_9BASI|nr:hypothetical protein EX895_001959 [Sporisorium graminicola]TKY89428.1 hypothetical protein EX895_001959 [Sporisorium graminicola]